MKTSATSAPLFFPEGAPGPWGVDTIGSDWAVIHRETMKSKRIGPISKGRGINYYDRAMTEAARRNMAARLAHA